VSADPGNQSPQQRAMRYLAQAEQARLMIARSLDPVTRESFRRMIADWEYLAAYALRMSIDRPVAGGQTAPESSIAEQPSATGRAA
jgi:hypothetical protein